MAETYEMACERLGKILDLLDDLAAAMDTVLIHQDDAMTSADKTARVRLVNQAKLLLEEIKYRG